MMPSPLGFWIYIMIMFSTGAIVGYNWHKRKFEVENEALREYATHKPGCYENGNECICGLDALLKGEKDDQVTQ